MQKKHFKWQCVGSKPLMWWINPSNSLEYTEFSPYIVYGLRCVWYDETMWNHVKPYSTMLDIARHSRWNRPPKSLPKSKNCLSHLSGQLQSLWSLANEKSFLTMTNSKPINWSKDYWSVGLLNSPTDQELCDRGPLSWPHPALAASPKPFQTITVVPSGKQPAIGKSPLLIGRSRN